VSAPIVVDASAFLAVTFGEPEGRNVEEHLKGRRFIAPTLLLYEIANVTLVKMRRHPDRSDAYREAFDAFLKLAIDFAVVDFSAVFMLAQRRNLTAYDASYVWLACSRGWISSRLTSG
jgi:predicted nucleic acid-binding protein